MRIYDLKTEHRARPIGLDAASPRFSWKLESDRKNVMQSSYQILAYADEGGKCVLWDSGAVDGDKSQCVRWEGPDLKSAERVYWKVRINAGGEFAESEMTYFEMGLLRGEDWRARWIEPEGDVNFQEFQPAPYLRKTFRVKEGLRSARIYQTAHGLYDFWMNGKPGTEEKFKPGFTSYSGRIQYQAYDITEMLSPGENVWGVILGDGWWRGTIGGMSRNNWGYKLHFLGQILLTYEDGSREYVCSDESFKTFTGGIRVCDMKAGETFCAQKEPTGWKEAGFDDSEWKNVHVASGQFCQKELLVPSRSVPVMEKERFSCKTFRDKEGSLILDFGQNIAGYVRMKLRGCRRGQEIVLVHGEDIKDGTFSVENLFAEMFTEERFQQIRYIAKGEEVETFCPTFSVFGFRYVKVTGYEGEIKSDDFVAVAVYSDLEETGDFSCSNPLVNRLVKNSRWSQKGNYLDVPTDCPTRERSPWTGDSQVYCRTAADFMDVYPFFEKWMQDYNLDQMKSGKFHSLVPSGMRNEAEKKRVKEKFFKSLEGKEELSMTDQMMLQMYADESDESSVGDGSAGWSDAAVINPYTMYLCYGDPQILKNQYESARKHVEYMFARAKNKNEQRAGEPEYCTLTDGELDADYIWDTEFHWGEWLEADVGTAGEMQKMMQKFTNPDPEVPTAFLCYSTRLLGEMAEILGFHEDARLYREKSEKVKRMFNKYLIGANGVIKAGRQAPNVRALAFGLCDDGHKKPVEESLLRMIRENDYHLNTGFLATPYILDVLVDAGYTETAYQLLEQETSPSWLYNVKKGATTILEEWNGIKTHVGSFNHYSYGAVCNFLFTRTAGIRPVISGPGYKEFLIEPVIGGSLKFAKAVYECPYGTIRSEWEKTESGVEYLFEIPANTKAIIRLKAEEDKLESVARDYPGATYEDGYIKWEAGSGVWKVMVATRP